MARRICRSKSCPRRAISITSIRIRSRRTFGIAYPSIPETADDYYVMRLAMEVLSGGMSGRLFTEVREKRALVYSVWAGYTSLKGSGSILGYAGTSNDRAQATLDCFITELHRFTEGVTAAELARAKTGLKASTIMQGESTSARAGAIAHDFFMRGRIRTLDEIKKCDRCGDARPGERVPEEEQARPVHDRDGRAKRTQNRMKMRGSHEDTKTR